MQLVYFFHYTYCAPCVLVHVCVHVHVKLLPPCNREGGRKGSDFTPETTCPSPLGLSEPFGGVLLSGVCLRDGEVVVVEVGLLSGTHILLLPVLLLSPVGAREVTWVLSGSLTRPLCMHALCCAAACVCVCVCVCVVACWIIAGMVLF